MLEGRWVPGNYPPRWGKGEQEQNCGTRRYSWGLHPQQQEEKSCLLKEEHISNGLEWKASSCEQEQQTPNLRVGNGDIATGGLGGGIFRVYFYVMFSLYSENLIIPNCLTGGDLIEESRYVVIVQQAAKEKCPRCKKYTSDMALNPCPRCLEVIAGKWTT